MALRNCSACARPVRTSEAACPFCAAALDAAPGPLGRVARATMTGVVALATGAGCTINVAPTPKPSATAKPSASPSVPVAQPVYGAPAQPQPVYGAPMPPQPTPTATPDGTTAPAYGAPPAPVYGAPAPPR